MFVPLAHRRATSLPHHHPLGLFLGRSQAPHRNGLPTVSVIHLHSLMKAGNFWFSFSPFSWVLLVRCIWSKHVGAGRRYYVQVWRSATLRDHLFLRDSALLFWNAITVFTPVRMTRTKWKNKPKFSFGCPNMLNPSKETPQWKSVCTCVSWTHSLWRLYCSGCWHAYRWR